MQTKDKKSKLQEEEEEVALVYENILDSTSLEGLESFLEEARAMYQNLQEKKSALSETKYWEELKWILRHEQAIYKRLYQIKK